MAEKYYTAERQIQVLISLLKKYGIKKIIASPGTTNLTFVASLQHDPYFEIYSAPEERSGAYMAVGMAEESGEPVVITCTGATASRNYLPALTEAYYRKLPVIAVTATQPIGRVGQLVPQVIDRSSLPKDTHVYSFNLGTVKDDADYNDAVIYINEAFHHLTKNGGGPIHINMETSYSSDFTVKELPAVRKIHFVENLDEIPQIPEGRIGIYVGSHSKMSEELTSAIDKFCETYNAVVFCDNTSNYWGKFRFQYPLLLSQDNWHCSLSDLKLMIHIGEISGSYACPKANEIWRINEDGLIRSPFGIPTYIFQLKEKDFFEKYSEKSYVRNNNSYADELNDELKETLSQIPDDLPFSNIWIAKELHSKLPSDSVVHFGILNSLRSWNFFQLPEGISTYSNVGGFGIDGALSTVIGGALAQPEKMHYLIVGDLAFFYDMNSLGNRHVPSNLRILLINNGLGTEFRNYNHPGSRFGEKADEYIAAGGHYGKKSSELVRHYCEDLGFHYITASNKEEFSHQKDGFLSNENKCPVLFEIFTTQKDENDALITVRNLRIGAQTTAINTVRKIISPQGVKVIKKILGK